MRDRGAERQEPGPSPAGGPLRGSHPIREQENLWNEVLGLADHVEQAIETAIEALCEGRSELVAEVRAEGAEIDRWEVRIEQECLRALALYELVAIDLRRVVAALRINRELERLADIAESLANRTPKLGRDPSAGDFLPLLRDLARSVLGVVGGCLQTLRTLDSQQARALVATDREIDRQRAAILSALKQRIREQPERVGTWLRLINSARSLARVGDHATHIAAAVVYLKEGVLLHGGEE
jgi:phosphate transport system protein